MADILPDAIDSGNDVCINFLEAIHKQNVQNREMIPNHSAYSFDFKGFSESMLDGAVHMIYLLRGMKQRIERMKFSIDTIGSTTTTDFFQHFYDVENIIFEGVPMTNSLVNRIALRLPTLERDIATDSYKKVIQEINFSGCGLTDEMLGILAPHLALIARVNLANNPALTKEGYQPLIKAVQHTTTREISPFRMNWLALLYVNDNDKEYLEDALPDIVRHNSDGEEYKRGKIHLQ